MINVIVFTKDRPMQLDLLLESIQDHIITKPTPFVQILAKITSDNYRAGYEITKERYSNYTLIEEMPHQSFKGQLNKLLSGAIYPYTLCFLDDDVVINSVDMLQVFKGMKMNYINAFSLRMGKNITYCYPKAQEMVQPSFNSFSNNTMMWDWTEYNPSLDWGYPMSVGGNVYRTDDFKILCTELDYDGPNYLEGYMHIFRPTNSRPIQVSFTEQKVYNVANNLVQEVSPNRFEGNTENDVSILNAKYLDGKKIDKYRLYGRVFNSANGPAEYKIKKRESKHGI